MRGGGIYPASVEESRLTAEARRGESLASARAAARRRRPSRAGSRESTGVTEKRKRNLRPAEEPQVATKLGKGTARAGNGFLRVVEGGSSGGGSSRAPERGGRERARRGEISPQLRRRRRLVTALLLLACAGIIALVLKGPVTRLVESRRELASTEARLAEEEKVTRELEERKARDLTDRYVEMEARRMGYVKPGEIPIVVLDARGEGSESEEAVEPTVVAPEESPAPAP